MSRAKKSPQRTPQQDPRFQSELVAKIVNRSMHDGKKNAAQKQVYKALEIVAQTLKREPMEILEEALRKITPLMEVRSRRVGGASYQVPMPVRPDRGVSVAVRWLVIEANKRSNGTYHSYAEKLAAEMMDALKEEGGAFSKKLTTHKMAEANKAFAHFRW